VNWRNPAVQNAQPDVMRSWLDRGVDGFRIDAFRHLLKDEQLRDNPPNPHWRVGMPPYEALLPQQSADHPDIGDLVAAMRAVIDNHPAPSAAAGPGDRVLLGELYLPSSGSCATTARMAPACTCPRNMHLIDTPWQAERIGALVDAYETALPEGAWPNWVLGNHDRSRIAPRVGAAQARVAAILLLTLRGTPTLYLGDEIGMHDVPVAPELVQDPYVRRVPGLGLGRDPGRAPMRWSSQPGAGFCPPQVTPWLPLAEDAAGVDVASQSAQEGSMLTLYQRLLALRRSRSALSVGSYRPLHARDDVLAYVREHESQRILIALNLCHKPRTVELSGAAGGWILLSSDPQRATNDLEDMVTLGADEGIVIHGRTV